MKVIFDDGKVVELTVDQLKSLKSIRVPYNGKYSFDYMVGYIPVYLAKNGDTTESVLFNRMRSCNRVILKDAIEFLKNKGTIIVNKKENLYNKYVATVLSLSANS